MSDKNAPNPEDALRAKFTEKQEPTLTKLETDLGEILKGAEKDPAQTKEAVMRFAEGKKQNVADTFLALTDTLKLENNALPPETRCEDSTFADLYNDAVGKLGAAWQVFESKLDTLMGQSLELKQDKSHLAKLDAIQLKRLTSLDSSDVIPVKDKEGNIMKDEKGDEVFQKDAEGEFIREESGDLEMLDACVKEVVALSERIEAEKDSATKTALEQRKKKLLEDPEILKKAEVHMKRMMLFIRGSSKPRALEEEADDAQDKIVQTEEAGLDLEKIIDERMKALELLQNFFPSLEKGIKEVKAVREDAKTAEYNLERMGWSKHAGGKTQDEWKKEFAASTKERMETIQPSRRLFEDALSERSNEKMVDSFSPLYNAWDQEQRAHLAALDGERKQASFDHLEIWATQGIRVLDTRLPNAPFTHEHRLALLPPTQDQDEKESAHRFAQLLGPGPHTTESVKAVLYGILNGVTLDKIKLKGEQANAVKPNEANVSKELERARQTIELAAEKASSEVRHVEKTLEQMKQKQNETPGDRAAFEHRAPALEAKQRILRLREARALADVEDVRELGAIFATRTKDTPTEGATPFALENKVNQALVVVMERQIERGKTLRTEKQYIAKIYQEHPSLLNAPPIETISPQGHQPVAPNQVSGGKEPEGIIAGSAGWKMMKEGLNHLLSAFGFGK